MEEESRKLSIDVNEILAARCRILNKVKVPHTRDAVSRAALPAEPAGRDFDGRNDFVYADFVEVHFRA